MAENNFIDSKFRQVILAAKRARQLLGGSKKKIEINAENPLTIALEEIKQGKVDFEVLLHDEMDGLETDTSLEGIEAESDEESGEESDSDADTEAKDSGEDESKPEEVSPPADPE